MKKGLKVVKDGELEMNTGLYDVDYPRHGKLKLKIIIIGRYGVEIQYHKEAHLEVLKQIPPPLRDAFGIGPLFNEFVKVNLFERMLGITLKGKISRALVRIKKELIKDGQLYSRRMSELEEFMADDKV